MQAAKYIGLASICPLALGSLIIRASAGSWVPSFLAILAAIALVSKKTKTYLASSFAAWFTSLLLMPTGALAPVLVTASFTLSSMVGWRYLELSRAKFEVGISSGLTIHLALAALAIFSLPLILLMALESLEFSLFIMPVLAVSLLLLFMFLNAYLKFSRGEEPRGSPD